MEITTNEFWTSLEKTFSSKGFRDFKSHLLKNEKKQKKSTNSKAPISDSTIPSIEEDLTLSQEDTSVLETTLQDLKKKELSLQDKVCHEELYIHNLNSKKTDLSNCLCSERKGLKSLLIEVENYKEKINNLINEYTKIESEINSKSKELSEDKKELKLIREQILSKQKVCIYAFTNGDIEFENNSYDIPETWTELFKKLIQTEEFEALTIKQLKQLAKIAVLTKVFKEKNIQFDIVFDSDELSKYFELITN